MLDNTNLFNLLTISYRKSVLAVEVGGTPVYIVTISHLFTEVHQLTCSQVWKHYSKPQRGMFGSCKNNLLVLSRL